MWLQRAVVQGKKGKKLVVLSDGASKTGAVPPIRAVKVVV
jgi:hypothetical protein